MAAKKVTIKPVAKPASAAVKTIAPKTEENKAEVKKVEAPAAAVQAEAKPVEKEEAPVKKEAAKKAETKKADVKKAETKKASVKKTAKKAEPKSEIHIQFSNKSYGQDDLVKIAKDVWKYDLKQKVGDLEKIELYVKPEEGKVYYVMNKDFTGSFDI